jgi:predicted CoA-binding protein
LHWINNAWGQTKFASRLVSVLGQTDNQSRSSRRQSSRLVVANYIVIPVYVSIVIASFCVLT